MKRAYEITFKENEEYRTRAVKADTLINAIYMALTYNNGWENIIEAKEIAFERCHALNIAAAIREADTWDECENECSELCWLAGMESEWLEADGDTFEAVLIEAAKKLNVKI